MQQSIPVAGNEKQWQPSYDSLLFTDEKTRFLPIVCFLVCVKQALPPTKEDINHLEKSGGWLVGLGGDQY